MPEFRLNDLICRRYPGVYRHPLDENLMGLPWWLKEAIALLELEEPGLRRVMELREYFNGHKRFVAG